MTITDDELNEGLSPVNNFQPSGVRINAVETPTAQASAPTDSQASMGEVVQVEPLQPDGQGSEEAGEVTIDTQDVRPPSLEEVSKKPPTEVAPMVSGQPKMETPVSTARANQESAPADNRYGIESRPVITIIDAQKTNKTAQETPMGDEEWNTSQATEATPNPVEVTRTDLKTMPVEEGDFEARYRNWEKVHASKQASILAKMKARDEKYAEMESTIDAENEKLAGFKVDRLG